MHDLACSPESGFLLGEVVGGWGLELRPEWFPEAGAGRWLLASLPRRYLLVSRWEGLPFAGMRLFLMLVGCGCLGVERGA